MKLSDADTELIETITIERMDQLIAAHRVDTKDDWNRLREYEQRYWEVLNTLAPDDANAIHSFHDQSFTIAADEEKMLYKSGVFDGLRVAKYFLELLLLRQLNNAHPI